MSFTSFRAFGREVRPAGIRRSSIFPSALRAGFAAAMLTLAACGGGSSGGGLSPGSGGSTPVPVVTPTPGAKSTATATPVPAPTVTALPTLAPTTMPSATAVVTPIPGAGTSSSTGAQPGPAILFASPAMAPQLDNTGIWVAPPILVSGASSYRDGEYVYQDFLFDDFGAKGAPDATQTNETVADLLAMHSGTYTYPTGTGYSQNAADLVEFRMKPTANATAFRVTLNTMIDPTLYAFTIGLGSSTTSNAMPHGANASEPSQLFVTVHGTAADVVDGATGAAVGTTAPTVTVDQTHRQVQVLVPYSTLDTRTNTALRVAVAVGLWNNSAGTYLVPSATSSATSPGGAAALDPAAFFNVGFRHTEPANGASADGSVTTAAASTYWRESLQATALANGDLSSFSDSVDMTKLAAGTNDDMNGQPQGVPLTGHMNRIFSSHYEPYEGRNFSGCSGTSTACGPELGGALEPYSIYVPTQSAPSNGYPLTLLLHSLSCNYNQYANTNYEMEFGQRNNGNIVFTTESRGPDDWYQGLAESEVFEVWNDVEQHYPIDNNSVALTGYSMGGYATFRLGAQFPDLFGILQPTVGPAYIASGNGDATDTKPMLSTLRNLPLLSWHGTADELVQLPFALEEEQDEAADNLNFEFDLFTADHLALILNDSFQPAATFLGVPKNNVNPPHVTYVRNPSMDTAMYGVTADHAYWVSNITERSTSAVTGAVDVFSSGFGVGDPPVSGTTTTAGSLPQGDLGVLAYTGFKNSYGTPPAQPVSDALTITATNISAITIAPARAKIDCGPMLTVTTDGPLSVTLDGCGGSPLTFMKGHSSTRVQGHLGRR